MAKGMEQNWEVAEAMETIALEGADFVSAERARRDESTLGLGPTPRASYRIGCMGKKNQGQESETVPKWSLHGFRQRL